MNQPRSSLPQLRSQLQAALDSADRHAAKGHDLLSDKRLADAARIRRAIAARSRA